MYGELSQWLRSLVVLAEGLCSIPSTFMVAHNLLELQVQGIWHPLFGHQVHTWYTLTCAGKHSHVKQRCQQWNHGGSLKAAWESNGEESCAAVKTSVASPVLLPGSQASTVSSDRAAIFTSFANRDSSLSSSLIISFFLAPHPRSFVRIFRPKLSRGDCPCL